MPTSSISVAVPTKVLPAVAIAAMSSIRRRPPLSVLPRPRMDQLRVFLVVSPARGEVNFYTKSRADFVYTH